MLGLFGFSVLLFVAGYGFHKHWHREKATLVSGVTLVAFTLAGAFAWWGVLMLWSFFALAAIAANHRELRLKWLSQPVFKIFKKILPPMSQTEKEALDAGDVWWEGEIFRGEPNFAALHAYPKPKLTNEEASFIDNQVEQFLKLINDWKVTHELADLPQEAWDYAKKEGFFGMIIPKQYGGREFSAYAHSVVVSKIASHSTTAAVTVMVPNSLGPAELLLHYGTKEQKDYYLPRLARGEEIPCFGLTAPEAGSDAGAIPDKGIICHGEYQGKKVLGIRLSFDKRYITLAPVATVLGVAFKLYDPDKLMGDTEDFGITLALIPANHPGVETGLRHYPLSVPFHNGPMRAKDIFIPMEFIIGGFDMAGKGWRMLVECLSAGRGISLPALATATGKLTFLTTGAYARVRKQFKVSIGQFEGVQEAMARIAGLTYILEASRVMTAGAVDLGVKPSVVSAIAKYHMTEMGRQCMNDAMDIHAGRGIILGPRNYIGRGYQGYPISITVEGANILTRSLIIYGQGAVRCHPFVIKEMEATQIKDEKEALETFDSALKSHIAFSIANFSRAFWYGLTRAFGAKAPFNDFTAKYYRHITRLSSALSFTSDVAMLSLGGALKRKERLSARLGDVLSSLYLATTVLKYFEDQGRAKSDEPFVTWAQEKLLHDAENALIDFCKNLPNRWLGNGLRLVLFPTGRAFSGPSDDLGQQLALEMMKPSQFRDRLTEGVYIGHEINEPVYRMEQAFLKLVAAAPIEAKWNKNLKEGRFERGESIEENISNAKKAGVLTEAEARELQEAWMATRDAIDVDEFESEYLKREKVICQNTTKQQVA